MALTLVQKSLPRDALRFAAAIGVLACLSLQTSGQSPPESFEEKLRKAAETQAKRNQADEEEQKRLVAEFKAKREALQTQEEADLRQCELAYRQRLELIKRDEAAARKELEARLNGDARELSKALSELTARMAAREAEAAADFKRQREAFHQNLTARIAEELAKAEAERERKKQIAIAAAMTYFTGGATFPALAGAMANASGTAAIPAKTAPSPKPAAPVTGNPSRGAKPATPAPTKPTTLTRKQGGKGGYDREVYRKQMEADAKGIQADWLDPIGFLALEGIQAARGLGTMFSKMAGSPKFPIIPVNRFGPASGTAALETGAAELAPASRVAANRLRHIFGNPEHALDGLVTKFGSEERAFEAVQQAANKALADGKLIPGRNGVLPSGDGGVVLDVGGIPVRLIGGRVRNGAVELSSFSRKGL